MNRIEPNTGLAGFPKVIPDRDSCPVCGDWLTIRNRDGARFEAPGKCSVDSVCSFDAAGNLAEARLRWRCNRCGARWMHGQEMQ